MLMLFLLAEAVAPPLHSPSVDDEKCRLSVSKVEIGQPENTRLQIHRAAHILSVIPQTPRQPDRLLPGQSDRVIEPAVQSPKCATEPVGARKRKRTNQLS